MKSQFLSKNHFTPKILVLALVLIVLLIILIIRTEKKSLPTQSTSTPTWTEDIAKLSGQTLAETQNFGIVVTAFYCSKDKSDQLTVNNAETKPDEYLVTRYKNNQVLTQKLVNGINEAATLVKEYCALQ